MAIDNNNNNIPALLSLSLSIYLTWLSLAVLGLGSSLFLILFTCILKDVEPYILMGHHTHISHTYTLPLSHSHTQRDTETNRHRAHAQCCGIVCLVFEGVSCPCFALLPSKPEI